MTSPISFQSYTATQILWDSSELQEQGVAVLQIFWREEEVEHESFQVITIVKIDNDDDLGELF